MQINKYTAGGWCIHRVELKGYKGHFSLYVNEKKQLEDAEQMFSNGSRPVKVGGPIWKLLEFKLGFINLP